MKMLSLGPILNVLDLYNKPSEEEKAEAMVGDLEIGRTPLNIVCIIIFTAMTWQTIGISPIIAQHPIQASPKMIDEMIHPKEIAPPRNDQSLTHKEATFHKEHEAKRQRG